MLVADMPRAFKRLGILHPEPHLPLLKEAGGLRDIDDKFDYVLYSQNLMLKIEKTLGLNVKRN